ncbi:hypothetical protein SLA2020_356270 [Shorea laevis]
MWVFRGCRALLAPASAAMSSSAGPSAAATKSQSKSTEKPKTASPRKPKSPPRTMVRSLAFSRSLLFPLHWARFLEPIKPLAVMQSSRFGPT